ncbi:MAG: type I restriction-modification system subunit M N-terminal domain-containing protein [Planctomycetaceae bacterium]
MKLNPKDGSTGIKPTQQQLEAHLWGAANVLRGKTAGQDYKNYYILSLMFFKRLCDQWEHECDRTCGGHALRGVGLRNCCWNSSQALEAFRHLRLSIA